MEDPTTPCTLIAPLCIWILVYLEGKVEEAIAQSQHALEEQIDRYALFNLGLFYLSSGQIDQARKVYAEGIQHFGPTAAAEIGVADHLKNLIAAGMHTGPASEILNKYWPP